MAGQNVNDATRKPAGYGQDTSISSASNLPALATAQANNAKVALIQAENADLRWRDDGTDPTTSVGMILASGDSFLYIGAIEKVRVISATGYVNVSYYK